eukprot:scaffold412157_cov23-Prasinocladus_malaysianus.AAC.1
MQDASTLVLLDLTIVLALQGLVDYNQWIFNTTFSSPDLNRTGLVHNVCASQSWLQEFLALTSYWQGRKLRLDWDTCNDFYCKHLSENLHATCSQIL